MIVVLLIVSLSVAAIAAALPRISAGSSIELAASRLAAGLKKARMRAISTERVVAVSIDPATRRFHITGTGRAVGLPGRVEILGPYPSRVRFYPDGGADSATIQLAEGRRRLRVDVSPMTGRVVVR